MGPGWDLCGRGVGAGNGTFLSQENTPPSRDFFLFVGVGKCCSFSGPGRMLDCVLEAPLTVTVTWQLGEPPLLVPQGEQEAQAWP